MKTSNFSMKTILVFAVYFIQYSLELDYSKIQVAIFNLFLHNINRKFDS